MKSATVLSRLAALCAVLVLVWSSAADAQRFKWWQSEEYKKELGLTAEQIRQLEDVFQKALPTLKAQNAKLEEAEQKFQRLIDQGDQAAMEQIHVVEAARKELNVTRGSMLLGMRRVLTREQWARFTALQAASAPPQGRPAPGPAATEPQRPSNDRRR